MKRIKEWLKASNRGKHLIGGFLIGMGAYSVYCAAYAGIGVASALEFKDKCWGGDWDWIDWLMTVVGTIIGNTLIQCLHFIACGEVVWGW
jgi:hypothetical protein